MPVSIPQAVGTIAMLLARQKTMNCFIVSIPQAVGTIAIAPLFVNRCGYLIDRFQYRKR